MRRYGSNKSNFYSTGKAILSMGMVLHDWWKATYNIRELADAFGHDALQRGVDAAREKGETIPQQALDDLKSVYKR